MTYLITGGAGFIGSHLASALLERGETVRILDNFSTGKRENVYIHGDAVELVEGDIRSYHIVREAMEGVDVVLHQAALPSVPRSIRDPLTTNEVNVTGTLNLLQAARDAGVKRMVMASSSSVYGDNPELPKHEGMVPNPLSPYAVSKLAGEKYFGVFNQIYGIETIALRYFNVFGPRQDPNSQYSAVIPKFITMMMKGEQPTINGDGTQSRDFTYIDNVVHGNLLAATSDCETGIAMNCACHDRITLNQLVEMINQIIGTNIQAKHGPDRAGDIKHSFAAIDRIREVLKFEPQVNFEEGLKRTVEFYKNQVD